jgi:hypothetical protein
MTWYSAPDKGSMMKMAIKAHKMRFLRRVLRSRRRCELDGGYLEDEAGDKGFPFLETGEAILP